MAVLDENLSVPFSIANQNLRYVRTIHGQFTNDTLNYIDDLTIGSRYTVRGFDGETQSAYGRPSGLPLRRTSTCRTRVPPSKQLLPSFRLHIGARVDLDQHAAGCAAKES
jgi:hemolysin activation/secretion protein